MNLGIDLKNSFFTKFYNIFFLSAVEKRLYRKFHLNKNEVKNKKIILIQCVEDLAYFSLFGEIIKSLRRKENIQVEQYVLRNLTLGETNSTINFIKSIFFYNRFRDNKWIRLYSAYCDRVAYRHTRSNFVVNIKTFFQAYRIYHILKTKDDILALEIDNIKVGDLIYDSYLRFKPAATVDVNSFYLCMIIWQTIKSLIMTKHYFEEKSPSVLLTSYSTYIQHGIAVRMAVKYNIKVYSFGNYQSFTKELTLDDTYHTAKYEDYRQDFLRLPNQERLLENARAELKKRFIGEIDNATAYMSQSAYIQSNVPVPNVNGSIIVFLHDFFDSPHVYGNMIFPDFLEWIEFTIGILEEQNIPYFLKSHPNQIDESKQIIKKLKKKYPNIKLISPQITNKQLVEEKMSVGVTVYGTVAHELVYLGVPVIVSGNNPHSSYDFCNEAKTKEEYAQLLKEYKNLTVDKNAKKKVESFYYMHNLNRSKEMSVLISAFIHLLQFDFQNFDEIKYNKLINNIVNNKEFENFIESLLGEII